MVCCRGEGERSPAWCVGSKTQEATGSVNERDKWTQMEFLWGGT